MKKSSIPGVAVHEGKTDPSAPPRPAVAPAELPKRVLVVDDSPVNRKVLTALLKKAGI